MRVPVWGRLLALLATVLFGTTALTGCTDKWGSGAKCQATRSESACDEAGQPSFNQLLSDAGWKDGRGDASKAPNGDQTVYAVSRKYTCLPHFMWPKGSQRFVLTRVTYDYPSDAKPEPEVLAEELPASWKVDNLKQDQFNQLVGRALANGSTELSPELSQRLKAICQTTKK